MRTILFVAFACCLGATEIPLATSVCALGENPETYHGKLVAVRAVVELWDETQGLSDDSCEEVRLWFDSEEHFTRIDAAWRSVSRPGAKVTATVTGRFETGQCYGHGCFSQHRLVVQRFTAVLVEQLQLAAGFSSSDCRKLEATVRVPFEHGHIHNELPAPVEMSEFRLLVADEAGAPFDRSRPATVQLALNSKRIVTVRSNAKGVHTLPQLAPGAYAFSTVARGFQSVGGCAVIRRDSVNKGPHEVRLPLGV